jgi:protocatechuate 3,4-dioxygenase alpha subunit
MNRPPLRSTPSQTVGPYFAYGLVATAYGYAGGQVWDAVVAGERATGEHILFEGRVFDGAGEVVPDALVELVQADAQGRYAGRFGEGGMDGFRGVGRVGTGMSTDGRFVFRTVKPGQNERGAPHVNLILFMRGMLRHLYTRVYFSDEERANAGDPVLRAVPEGRRRTLIATRVERAGQIVYELDLHMQGAREAVFFDC